MQHACRLGSHSMQRQSETGGSGNGSAMLYVAVARVMCCSEEEKKKYPQELLHEVDTHIAPSYTVHPVTHDSYAAYNKPEAVIDWLQHVTPEEEYILVLDSDMILRRPFLVEQMHPSPGMAVGAKYTYMIGVNNELAMRHVPEVQPRNDTLAGPYGRRGDQVGGFFFIHRDDLKRMSTLWLKYTEDVRADPMVCECTESKPSASNAMQHGQQALQQGDCRVTLLASLPWRRCTQTLPPGAGIQVLRRCVRHPPW